MQERCAACRSMQSMLHGILVQTTLVCRALDSIESVLLRHWRCCRPGHKTGAARRGTA